MVFTEINSTKHNWTAVSLTVIVVFAVIPVTATPVGAQNPASHTGSAKSPSQGTPEFLQEGYSESRGDIVTIGIDLQERTNTTLRIRSQGGSASEFSAELHLHDTNGDGQIKVRLNTYTLGIHPGAITARGSDTATVTRETPLSTRLKTGTYRLVLEAMNEIADESTLHLTPAGIDKVRVLTANDSRPLNLSTTTKIQKAIENGTFTEEAFVSTRDTLLVELRVSGLGGALRTQSGADTTTRFLNLLNASGFAFRLQENESTVNLEQDRNVFTLTPAATTVVASEESDTYYLLTQLGQLPRHELGSDRKTDPELESGDLFDLNFTLDERSGIVKHRVTRTAQFQLIGWAAADTPVRVTATRNQTITLQSSYEKGVDVKVVLADANGSFRVSRVVDTSENGTIVASFDLSNLSTPSMLTLTVVDESSNHVILFKRGAVHVRPTTPTPTNPSTPPAKTPTESNTSTNPSNTSAVSFETPSQTATSVPGFQVVAPVIAVGLAVALLRFGRR